MEPKQHYLIVGIFVLLTMLAGIGFVVWLAGFKQHGDFALYQTYVKESVNGLGVGSPVKYRGVEVGKVKTITIPHENPESIRILLEVDARTPITTETVAVLQLQGITGTSYIELKGTTATGQQLESSENGVPTIPSAPSEFRQIVDSVPAILEKFSDLADKLGNFASDENSARFASIMTNLDKFSGDVGGENGQGQSLIAELHQTAAAIGQAANSISKIANGSRADTQKILSETANTVEKINGLVENTGKLSQASAQDLHELLLEMKKTARDIQSLSRELKENPSQIIIPAKPNGVKLP